MQSSGPHTEHEHIVKALYQHIDMDYVICRSPWSTHTKNTVEHEQARSYAMAGFLTHIWIMSYDLANGELRSTLNIYIQCLSAKARLCRFATECYRASGAEWPADSSMIVHATFLAVLGKRRSCVHPHCQVPASAHWHQLKALLRETWWVADSTCLATSTQEDSAVNMVAGAPE